MLPTECPAAPPQRAPCVLSENIPTDLRARHQWVCVRVQQKPGGRFGKTPYTPAGNLASITDDATHSPFRDCLHAVLNDSRPNGYVGVLYALKADDGYVILDLDDCVDADGAVAESMQAIIDRIASYTEISLSGRGIRIVAKGTLLPDSPCRRGGIAPGVEMYDKDRFASFTGRHLHGTPKTIEERTDALRALNLELFGPPVERKPAPVGRTEGLPDDATITAKAIASKYGAVCGGDISGHQSPSEADYAAAKQFGFFAGKDSTTVERLMRQSPLRRDKWDEHPTYLMDTISKALAAGDGEIYDWNRANDQAGDREDVRCVAGDGAGRGGEGVGVPPSAKPPVPAHQPPPIPALPDAIRLFVEYGMEAHTCPAEFILGPTLGVLATVTGYRACLRITRDWQEVPVLWLANIGDSGSGKTAAFNFALRALRKKEDRLMVAYQGQLDRYEEQLAGHDKLMLQWKQNKSTTAAPPGKPKPPACPRFIAIEATAESIPPMIVDNPMGLGYFPEELQAFFGGMNQYKSGGKGSDESFFLSAHGAAPFTVDRKGRPALRVPAVALSLCGSIPPKTFAASVSEKQADSGLKARFLLMYPPDTRKQRPRDMNDSAAVDAMSRIIDKLASIEPVEEPITRIKRPREYVMDAAAQVAFWKFYELHQDDVFHCADHHLKSHWSKLEGQCARLALLFHLVRWAAGEPVKRETVDVQSVESAVALIGWFKSESARIYQLLAGTDGDRELNAIAHVIRSAYGGTITIGQLARHRKYRSDAALAEERLERMVRRGYGKWVHPPAGKIGRPAGRYFELFDRGDAAPTAADDYESEERAAIMAEGD